MRNTRNIADSETFRITVSKESVRLLREIAARGIYGRTVPEVAARFVDAALDGFAVRPKFKLRSSRIQSNEE